MTRIGNNIKELYQELSDQTQLIVVSKYREIDEIKEVYNVGHRVFAENRVQALLERYSKLPEDIQWHLIGHLQTNKVKYIAPFISMIQSVDSIKLLLEIEKQACKNNRKIPVLIQLHVAQEESKFGIPISKIPMFFEELISNETPHILYSGLMAMASNTENSAQIESEFNLVKSQFQKIKDQYFENHPEFKEISMGMSGDYKTAIKCGSTMIRVGSKVFK